MTPTQKPLAILYKGMTYVFNHTDQKEDESTFMHRCWWIVRNVMEKPTTDTLDTLTRMSYLWAAVKFLGVTYDDDIMSQLSSYKDTL